MRRTIPKDATVLKKGTTEPLMQAGQEKVGDGGMLLIQCRWMDPEEYDGLMLEWIPQPDLELAPGDAKWPPIPWLEHEIEMEAAVEAGDTEAMRRANEKFEASGLPAKWRQRSEAMLAALRGAPSTTAD